MDEQSGGIEMSESLLDSWVVHPDHGASLVVAVYSGGSVEVRPSQWNHTVRIPISSLVSQDAPDFGQLAEMWDSCDQVGSSVTCDPPVLNTDLDYLVLAVDWQPFLSQALHEGWELSSYWGAHDTSSALDDGDFVSLRKGRSNIILTACDDFKKRFLLATKLAKQFNLLKKADRIALFQAVLYGKG